MGLEVKLLSPQELQPVAPYLGPSVVAASFCDKDARGNPLLSSIALARAAEARGARIRVNEEVRSIEANSGGRFTVGTSRGGYRTTYILNSAGVWAKNIFRMVGLDYPITLDTQQVMVTEQVPSIFPHVITHVEGNLTLKQMDSGNVLIGGGWKGIGDVDKNIKRVRYDSLIGNLRYACRIIPSLTDLNLIRCWAGLEGRSPDLLPIFGNLNCLPGFYSACCTKGGFTLGPILGKLISELIVKGKTSFQWKAFDVNRFINHM
jgi:glycine/D-amino acid oxidase-like deaminating enzyme